MSSKNIELILHLGQHKTGSKALQSALSQNAKVLESMGISYPNLSPNHPVVAYQISHFRLFTLLRYKAILEVEDSKKAEEFLKRNQDFFLPEKSLEELFTRLTIQCHKSKVSTLILSAEDIFDMHTAQEIGFNPALISGGARYLKNVCDSFGFLPKLVIYLRRQDYLAVAHYNQYVKSTAQPELEFESYLSLFFPRLKTFSILGYWREVFGDEVIQIRSYEKSTLPEGIVSDFFTHVLKKPFPQAWQPSPKTIETVNATPTRDYLEFILAQKKLGLSKGQFPQELILQEALKHHREGLSLEEWFTSDSQDHLLDQLKIENENLREFHTGKKDGSFFLEPVASAHHAWQSYPGFSPSKAIEIAREVHASSLETRLNELKQRVKNAGIRLVIAALFGLFLFLLYSYLN